MADAEEIAGQAYILYVKEKGFQPKNASQLINFCKFRKPPIVGVKYSTARGVVSNPPDMNKVNDEEKIEHENEENNKIVNIDSENANENDNENENIFVSNQAEQNKTEEKKQGMAPASNPYLDASVTYNFLTADESQKFVEKYEKPKTKSNIVIDELYVTFQNYMTRTEIVNLIKLFPDTTAIQVYYDQCYQQVNQVEFIDAQSAALRKYSQKHQKKAKDDKKRNEITLRVVQSALVITVVALVAVLIYIIYSNNYNPQNIKYAKALRGYNYVAAPTEKRAGSMQKVRDSLNAAGIGGFSVKAQGYAGLDMDEEVFDSYIGNLAKAWGWDEKITAELDVVTSIDRQFSGAFNVWFEPSSWKIMGDYQRFASFRNMEIIKENNGKIMEDTYSYSIYVATSKFEYTIPSDQREGGFLDRIGVKGGGAIKGEYFEQVGHLMEGESLQRFQIDISKPMLEDYQMYC